MIRAYLVHLLRLALGVMFLFSGLVKIRLPYQFLAIVCDYRVFGPRQSAIVAASIPWMEIGIGLCLLSRLLVPGAFLLAGALGAVFVALVGSAVYRQMNIKCGCFLSNDNISAATVLRSSLVLVAAMIGLVLSLRQSRTSAAG
jgi:uncharacterized membrane protein YphA (DoxX/SURF4 family)